MKPHVERITKLDAARRQLRTAVRMFFEEKDTVSTYTLAAAAEGVLAGILRRQGGTHFIRDSDFIRPEYKKEFWRLLDRPRNFFKHADRDPDDVLEFNPEVVASALLECAILYHHCTGRALREGSAFAAWFGIHHPNILKPGPFKTLIEGLKAKVPDANDGKSAFLHSLDRADLWPNTD